MPTGTTESNVSINQNDDVEASINSGSSDNELSLQ